MADLRFKDKNNQKKNLGVFASGVLGVSNIGDTLFTLPSASLVTGIYAVEADGTGVGESVLGGITEGTYYPTGATVTLASGITDSEKVIVTYVETELTTGEYTD